MNSFYGGKQGFSFVLARHFESVDAMVAEFSKGPGYTEVDYDEYVLINTTNKHNQTNGNVYRRGLDYTNELGGAVYVGTIVGPSGLAPTLVGLETIEDVAEMFLDSTDGEEDLDYRKSSNELSVVNDNLVPGATGKYYDREEFNDSIKWATCSLRDVDGVSTTAYMAFEFPYHVTDYYAESVSAYYNRYDDNEKGDFETGFTNQYLIDREDDEEHAFYSKYKISIPRGFKGDGYTNFRVIVANNDVRYPGEDCWTDVDAEDYEPSVEKADDIEHEREIIVCDFTNYERVEEGDTATIYIGDYNMIDYLDLADDGTFLIEYSHDNDYLLEKEKRLNWLTDLELDEETGNFFVEFNNENLSNQEQPSNFYQKFLTWVKSIEIDEYGSVTYDRTTDDEYQEYLIRWINRIELDTDDGTITFTYNVPKKEYTLEDVTDEDGNILYDEDGEKITQEVMSYSETESEIYTTRMDWVKSIVMDDDGTVTIESTVSETVVRDEKKRITWMKDFELDEDTGELVVEFNNDNLTNQNPTDNFYKKFLTWIQSITIQDDGTVRYHSTTDKLGESTETLQENLIKWIKDISMDDEGTITIDYNFGDPDKFIEILNWITGVEVSEDGDLSFSFNNSTEDLKIDGLITWITNVELLQDGTFNVTTNTGKADYDAQLKWVEDIVLQADGTTTVVYNTGDEKHYDKYIKFIDNIAIETHATDGEEGTGSQKVNVTYNTGDKVEIGEPLNYIMDTHITEDYHYVVRYSDPAKRAKDGIDGKNYPSEVNGHSDYYDLGAIKEENGILIGLNISLTEKPELDDITEAIDYLNETYASGLTGFNLRGRVASIGMPGTDQTLYAFDYTSGSTTISGYKGWFYLGTVAADTYSIMMVAGANDFGVAEKKLSLGVGGIWFEVEDV